MTRTYMYTHNSCVLTYKHEKTVVVPTLLPSLDRIEMCGTDMEQTLVGARGYRVSLRLCPFESWSLIVVVTLLETSVMTSEPGLGNWSCIAG